MDEYAPFSCSSFEVLVASAQDGANGEHAPDEGSTGSTRGECCSSGETVAGLDNVGAADVEGFVEGGKDTLRAATDGILVVSGELCGLVYLALFVGGHDIVKRWCYK